MFTCNRKTRFAGAIRQRLVFSFLSLIKNHFRGLCIRTVTSLLSLPEMPSFRRAFPPCTQVAPGRSKSEPGELEPGPTPANFSIEAVSACVIHILIRTGDQLSVPLISGMGDQVNFCMAESVVVGHFSHAKIQALQMPRRVTRGQLSPPLERNMLAICLGSAEECQLLLPTPLPATSSKKTIQLREQCSFTTTS